MADDNNQKHEMKDMTGSLWHNEKHVKGDNLPSMRGFIKVDGKEYRATAWTRFSQRDGQRYLSLSLQSREDWEREREAAKAAKGSTAAPVQPVNTEAVDEDDMPF